MIRNGLFFVLAAAVSFVGSAQADDAATYTLRYKFQPNETLRWDVSQLTEIRTTVSGVTQTAKTTSESVKVWKVLEVKPDGSMTFEHSVESVVMTQKMSGSAELRYDSKTDKKAPVGFEDAAASVGVPLTRLTLSPQGKVLSRERLKKKSQNAANQDGEVTMPLPEKAVAVGTTWSEPNDIDIPLPTGGVKKIKAIQLYKLDEVKSGVAVIHVETQIMTPITDPSLESQVIQKQSAGNVRFDIAAGRVVGQKMDVDKHVVGFRGEASSIHYLNRFTEEIVK